MFKDQKKKLCVFLSSNWKGIFSNENFQLIRYTGLLYLLCVDIYFLMKILGKNMAFLRREKLNSVFLNIFLHWPTICSVSCIYFSSENACNSRINYVQTRIKSFTGRFQLSYLVYEMIEWNGLLTFLTIRKYGYTDLFIATRKTVAFLNQR